MKLSEFKARVKELAGGKYYSVRVSVAEHPDGTVFYTWGAYIDGGNLIEARTPYEVFMRLKENLVEKLRKTRAYRHERAIQRHKPGPESGHL
jgi:hypothetical protein